jgi:hypothetical protein
MKNTRTKKEKVRMHIHSKRIGFIQNIPDLEGVIEQIATTTGFVLISRTRR